MANVSTPPGYSSGSGGKKGAKVSKPPGYSGPTGGRGGAKVSKPKGAGVTTGGGGGTKLSPLTKSFIGGGKGNEGGIAGIFQQAGETLRSVPTGIGALAKSGAEEVVVKPSEKIYRAVKEGDPKQLLPAPPGTTQAKEETPLTTGFKESFGRTLGDVRHPSRFVDAYERGEIVGKLLEDVGNVALVGGAAAKTLDAISAGTLERAAMARNVAAGAEKAVPTAEKAAQKLVATAAEHEQAVVDLSKLASEAKGPIEGYRSRLAQDIDVARSVHADAADTAQTALTSAAERRAFAATSKAQADRLAGEVHAVPYAAYRIARAVERLGNQGAAAPIKPFTAVGRALPAGVRKFVKANPAIESALGRFDERFGVIDAFLNRASRKKLASEFALQDAEKQQIGSQLGASVDEIQRVLGPDPLAWQTASAHAVGFGAAIADQVRMLGPGGPAALERARGNIAQIAESLGYDPGAIENAVQIALGTASKEMVAKVNAANAIYDAEIKPWTEGALLDENQGLKRNPNEAERAFADWELNQTDLPPGARESLAARREGELAKLVEKGRGQAAKVTRQAGKLGIVPGTPAGEAAAQIAARAGEQATVFGNIGRLRAVQAAARNEGRAIVASDAAGRFEALRAKIPDTVGDPVVHQIVDAVGRFQDAREALTNAVDAPTPEIVAHVRTLRAEAVRLAEAELVRYSDLPFSLPFIPGDLSPDYYGTMYDDIGGAGDASHVLTRMEELRAKLRGRNRPPTEAGLFRKAYKEVYNKLPQHVKNAFDLLDDASIDALWDRYKAGRIRPEIGDLDVLAQEYGLGLGGLTGVDAIDRMLKDYSTRARINGFLGRAKNNNWGPKTYNFLAGTGEGELLALLDDPVGAAALKHNLQDAAQHVAEAQGQAAREGVPMPDVERLQNALDDAPDNATYEQVVERAFGDDVNDPNSQSSRFFEAWTNAGSPDLEAAVDNMLEGRAPEWARAENLADRPGLETLRGQEEARSDIESIIGEAGGQPLDPELAREAAFMSSRARRAEASAAAGPEAERRLVAGVTATGAKKGVKAGRVVAKYEKSLNELHLTTRQINNFNKETQAQLDGLYNDLMNNPARARPALKVARAFTKDLADWKRELQTGLVKGEAGPPIPKAMIDQEQVDLLDNVIAAGIKDVRDIWGRKITGPGGTLVPAPPPFEPQYRIGGQPMKLSEIGSSRRASARAMRAKLSHEQMRKTEQLHPRSLDELRVAIHQKIKVNAENKATRMVASIYGRRANGVLTPDEMAGLKPEEIAVAMGEKGYVPWDHEQLFQRAKPSETGPQTLWLPETIMKAVENYFGEGNNFERFMRRWYDRPMTNWRHAVLALRPAWHVNNISGNGFMAMLGSGMDPLTYAKRFRQARAVLQLPEARRLAATPETAVEAGALTRGQQRLAGRVGKLEARAGTIEPEALQAMGGFDRLRADPRISEGAAGAAAAQPGELGELLDRPGIVKRGIQRSYAINGAIDDASRLGVFLEEHAKMTGADISNFQAKYPELIGLTREQVRTEGAVRLSLKIAGDFGRMTTVERQLFRRVVPFYAWIRHITGLTYRLATHNPVRVIWTLHLAEMLGTPTEMGLANAIPLGPNSVLQGPSLNPFQDVVDVTDPTDVNAMAFNLSPAIKLGLGAAFGIDLAHGGQFQRPPGQPGGYGGQPGGVNLLTRPRELLNLLGQQLPQTRVLRGVTDTITEGKPVMRYPLGQVRRTPLTEGRQPIESGEPIFGPLARYFGAPYERRPNVYEKPDVKEALKGPKRLRRRP